MREVKTTLKISVGGGVVSQMKKITAMVLALGLAVPAQAWHLFPVRKEIVTVKETDYVITAIIAVGVALEGLICFVHMNNKNRNLINELDTTHNENKHLLLERNAYQTERNEANINLQGVTTQYTEIRTQLEQKETALEIEKATSTRLNEALEAERQKYAV
jgi:chromosome segregation ATPase